MITLTYDDIELEVTHVVGWSRKAVYDARMNYLYTRHILHLQLLYNPFKNPHRRLGETPTPAMGFDQWGHATDEALRHHLLQPRKRLILSSTGNNAWLSVLDYLVAPLNNSGGQAGLGPIPLECNVTSVAGLKTWMVDYVIQVDVTDRDTYDGQAAKAVLSHVYAVESTLDFRLLESRKVTGTVVFRGDLLRSLDANPDDWRAFFIPRPPRGYRRDGLQVTADPDGLTVHYTFTDQQMIGYWPQWHNIQKLEIGLSVNEKLFGLQALVPGALNQVVDYSSRMAGYATATDEERQRKDPPNVAGTFVGVIGDALVKALPSTTFGLTIRAWGKVDARMGQFERLVSALAPAMTEFDKWANRIMPLGGSVESSLSADVLGDFVELQRVWMFPVSRLPGSVGRPNEVLRGNQVDSSLFTGVVLPAGQGRVFFYPDSEVFQRAGITWNPNDSPAHGIGEDLARGHKSLAVVAGVLSAGPEIFPVPRDQNEKVDPENP